MRSDISAVCRRRSRRRPTMAIWTDDPAHDAAMHDLEQEAANCRMLGVCEFCLEPVATTDNYMKGSDGQFAHLECVNEAAERLENYV
jgi:hypothetical protein